MTQQQERYSSHSEEEAVDHEQTQRAVGNQALKDEAATTDELIDIIDEVLGEYNDMTDEEAQTEFDLFRQKGGQ